MSAVARSPRTKAALIVFLLVLGLCLTTPVSAVADVSYTYDALGRLLTATYSSGTVIVYTYDAAGNASSRVVVRQGAWGSLVWGQGTW